MREGLRRVLRALNAPITIWVLSVVAVGIIGSVYTEMQHCRVEADRAAVNFHRLGTEIANRRRALYDAIQNSSSIDELRAAGVVRDWASQYTYLEFKDRTIKDLEDEYLRLGRQLRYSRPVWWWDMMVERIRQRDHAWEKLGTGSTDPIRTFALDRPDFSKLEDADLPRLKEAANRERAIMLDLSLEAFTHYVVPACGFMTAFQRVIFGRPDYVGMLVERNFTPPSQ